MITREVEVLPCPICEGLGYLGGKRAEDTTDEEFDPDLFCPECMGAAALFKITTTTVIVEYKPCWTRFDC